MRHKTKTKIQYHHPDSQWQQLKLLQVSKIEFQIQDLEVLFRVN